MRLTQSLRCLWLVVATGLSAVAIPDIASAWEFESEGTVATGGSLDGFDNPPNADKNGWNYVNPCLGHEGYEAHVSKRTSLVKNDVDKISIEVNGDVIKIESSSPPGSSIGYTASVDETFQVEYVEWVTACAATEDAPVYQFEPGTVRRYWIKRPTQGAIVPNLVADVTRRLPAPDVIWPDADPEFGWIYVNVDNDVRISPVNNVRAETTISNLVGSATVWVEASPSHIKFEPGEPGSPGMECTYAAATAPYVIERATSCFHRYSHSSAISTAADNAFVARTSVFWDIESSGPLTYSDPISWRQELIQVAEVQSLVTANS